MTVVFFILAAADKPQIKRNGLRTGNFIFIRMRCFLLTINIIGRPAILIQFDR